MNNIINFVVNNWELESAILVLIIDWYIGKNPNNPYNNILDVIESLIKKTPKTPTV
jgi:hypothetical protein